MRAVVAGAVIVGSITIYKFLDYRIRFQAQEARKRSRRRGIRIPFQLKENENDPKPVPRIQNAKDLVRFLWSELRDYANDAIACFIPKKKEVDLRGNLPEVRAILEQCHSIHQIQQVIVESSIMIGNARYYAEVFGDGAHDEEDRCMGPIHPIFVF